MIYFFDYAIAFASSATFTKFFRRFNKITEGHSVAVSQTRNDHINLYIFAMKVKHNFLSGKVNCGNL